MNKELHNIGENSCTFVETDEKNQAFFQFSKIDNS